ncbi:acyl carrier protein [Shimia sp.]|uniref:acyl carrier protein n=1 Tax=Shimia sp. TaxID=1954381 RepID=UPI003568A260
MLQSVDIENRLIATLQDFIADWGVEIDIDRDTTLVADLEFDSIDIIQLIVAIETEFGKRSPGFQELLIRDGRYVDDLGVGTIADFLATGTIPA